MLSRNSQRTAARARIRAWLRRLPARDRSLLTLLFYEGLTAGEAAHALGMPVREVRRALAAHLERLPRAVPTRSFARRSPAVGTARRKAA